MGLLQHDAGLFLDAIEKTPLGCNPSSCSLQRAFYIFTLGLLDSHL
jgi:hypothetical protein